MQQVEMTYLTIYGTLGIIRFSYEKQELEERKIFFNNVSATKFFTNELLAMVDDFEEFLCVNLQDYGWEYSYNPTTEKYRVLVMDRKLNTIRTVYKAFSDEEAIKMEKAIHNTIFNDGYYTLILNLSRYLSKY